MTACVVCFRDLEPTERLACVRCLGLMRRHLLRIDQLFRMLPGLMANLGAASALDSVLARGGDDATLPGGDLLVLMGPGSASHVGHPSDPPAVAFELHQWAEDWSEIRREGLVLPTSVGGLTDWLSARAGWAADHHPAVEEFAADLRRIVGRLEDVTDTSERPERGVSCPYCGVSLMRWATDQGYPDEWECKRCQKAFNPGQYALAVRVARADDAKRREEREAG